MSRQLRIFFSKTLLIVVPAYLLLAFYAWLDPFKVVRRYDQYYDSGQPNYVALNFEWVAMETFLRNHPKRHYDSFIFGNSRSRFFEVRDWQQHIRSDQGFHFDASAETLFGLHAKFRYLDGFGVKIKNALIVLDAGTLVKTTNSNGHLFIKHPVLTGESALEYQLTFFKAFLDSRFLAAYLYLKATKEVPRYTAEGYLSDFPVDYDDVSNECRYGHFEAMIARDSSAYYDARRKIFYPRNGMEAFDYPAIGEGQKKLLLEIREIMRRQQTSYQIVVSPLYDQRKMSPADLACLKDIFGDGHVHDFSGINRFTQNYTNYYETSHYRPRVAREIMEMIYQEPK